jgi:hypothetical protein
MPKGRQFVVDRGPNNLFMTTYQQQFEQYDIEFAEASSAYIEAEKEYHTRAGVIWL